MTSWVLNVHGLKSPAKLKAVLSQRSWQSSTYFPLSVLHPYFSAFPARKTPLRLNISYSMLLFSHYPVQKHIKKKKKSKRKQKILATPYPELSSRKNNRTVKFYQRNHPLMDEIHSIPMIVFNSSPLNLAIACNYYSIYPCEHWVKNGLIFSVWINGT